MKLLADGIESMSGGQTPCISDANGSLHPSTQPPAHLARGSTHKLLEVILPDLIFPCVSPHTLARENCFTQSFKVKL